MLGVRWPGRLSQPLAEKLIIILSNYDGRRVFPGAPQRYFIALTRRRHCCINARSHNE
jgi:hypothetical protein